MQPEHQSLASAIATVLARILRALPLDVTQEQATLAVAGHTVAVTPRIANTLEQAGQHFAAAEVRILCNGSFVPEMTAGVVGVGRTAESALQQIPEEWWGAYGVPIGLAIAAEIGGQTLQCQDALLACCVMQIDGVTLFRGFPAVRGAVRRPGAAFSDTFLRRVSTAVIALWHRREHWAEYRSALIHLTVEGGTVTDDECRIDGCVEPELGEALSTFEWPEGAPRYMFKLFLVAPNRQH